MVKAKDIKILRKKIEKVDQYDCSEMKMTGTRTKIRIVTHCHHGHDECGVTRTTTDGQDNTNDTSDENNNNNNITIDIITIFTIDYYSSSTIPKDILEQCYNIFEKNMIQLYQNSSWGYNLQNKIDELNHRKARFLILQPATVTQTSLSSNPINNNTKTIGGFVHFRFCYDDDDSPGCIVLYIYEIQIRDIYQKKYGLGQQLMSYIEVICQTLDIPKMMLTVFKNNSHAMKFYQHKLHFSIDATSPSQHGEFTDYEILSKEVVTARKK